MFVNLRSFIEKINKKAQKKQSISVKGLLIQCFFLILILNFFQKLQRLFEISRTTLIHSSSMNLEIVVIKNDSSQLK